MGIYPSNPIVVVNRYTLGDRVWLDSNQDGIQDANETGLTGIEVNLYDNANCTGASIANTSTNNGLYQFSNLVTGNYCVAFANLPADHNISLANQGGDNTLDSNANNNAQITNINLTANDNTLDMGIYPSNNAVLAATIHGNGCTCHPYEEKSISLFSNIFILLAMIFLTSLLALLFLKKEEI